MDPSGQEPSHSSDAPPHQPASPSTKGKRLALFVFIDALGWEILRHHSFLKEEAPHQQPLESIFGYSSTCDPTIITGLMPSEHRHFSFFFYSPATSPFRPLRWLRWLPKNFMNRGRVRHWISRLLKSFYGFTGYFQIYAFPFDRIGYFDYSEKRDIYEPGGINSGARTIFDELRDRGIPFHRSDWRASEETNLAALRADLSQRRPQFVYLYMAAMDSLLHTVGTASPRVTEKIAWYENQIRGILDIARAGYEDVALYVFSDHGMTDIQELCDLKARVEKTGLVFGQDYAAVFDSTMARFWFLTPKSREIITAALAGETRGRILADEELTRFGCHFQDHRYGELFFLLNPGVLLCPSDLGVKPLAGMHGYDPSDSHTHASFSTNQVLPASPRRLDDIYLIMHSEMEQLGG
jgi:predicted AlkP superfamily pyrophosphatase or phosphodiesterase